MVEDPEQLVGAVGQRIAELRRAAGLNQEKLAERLQCSVQYVSRIERGLNLSLHSLAKVANALNARVIDLLAMPAAPSGAPRRGRPRKG